MVWLKEYCISIMMVVEFSSARIELFLLSKDHTYRFESFQEVLPTFQAFAALWMQKIYWISPATLWNSTIWHFYRWCMIYRSLVSIEKLDHVDFAENVLIYFVKSELHFIFYNTYYIKFEHKGQQLARLKCNVTDNLDF